jgi:hypothetical protein
MSLLASGELISSSEGVVGLSLNPETCFYLAYSTIDISTGSSPGETMLFIGSSTILASGS